MKGFQHNIYVNRPCQQSEAAVPFGSLTTELLTLICFQFFRNNRCKIYVTPNLRHEIIPVAKRPTDVIF